jgi:hypothetical protein
MALKLYNAKSKAFETYIPNDAVSLPLDQVLLLNILIELKAITHFMANQTVGSAYENPQNILNDIVSVT